MYVTVRRAAHEDADGLSRLAALTFPLACTPQTPADFLADHVARHLDAASFRRHLSEPSTVVLLAQQGAGRDPVGYAMLLAGEPADPDVAAAITVRPTIALERCYVHPDHHGTGVARELMAATLDEARRTGARGVWLGVSEQNARANAFYARHGFEVVGRKRFHIGETWEDDNVRELRL
ncbi:N-acetyltransferase family protein [Nocardioides sp.]|uniref:GNAT family N-acetyltransferase n=1 Tax=Nocardioides sp. TaxID=35761 RepID=UPI0035B0485A